MDSTVASVIMECEQHIITLFMTPQELGCMLVSKLELVEAAAQIRGLSGDFFHLCGFDNCANPKHLTAQKENSGILQVEDGRKEGHLGASNGNAKLTIDQVKGIDEAIWLM